MDATEAMRMSARYDDDGTRMRDADGVPLREALIVAGARCDDDLAGAERYTLPDGSVITIAGGGWDLGYASCYCWQGAGHRDGCEDQDQ